MKNVTLLLFTLIGITSFSQSLIFESGYENSYVKQHWIQGVTDTNHADIIGVDNGWDWEGDIDSNPDVGFFVIRYEDGDTLVSKAEIIPEPGNPGNNVLSFWMTEPHITYNDSLEKGRIQGAFTSNTNLSSFYFKERLFLHPDLDFMTTYPDNITWFTIQEFWNNTISQPYSFRVTVNIRKIAGIDSLYFGAHGQWKDTINDVWVNIWDTIATTYPITVGTWLDIETYFHEGDSLNGKFRFLVTDSTGITNNVIDIVGATYHPEDPSPNGVGSFNPMKLYTSGPLIDTMTLNGKCVCLYWDDFVLYKDSTWATNDLNENSIVSELLAYPNPSGDKINIQTNLSLGAQVVIFDMTGKQIKEFNLNESSDFILYKEDFGKGIFILKIVDKNRGVVTEKIIFN